VTAPRQAHAGGRSIVIHGHFYQPPREDPWIELVEREPSAAPDHDWNTRIDRECYSPLAGTVGPVAAGLHNVFGAVSFDVGPTLFEWLEHAAPKTYAAILAADRDSARRFGGHGNAMAIPYHHVILPLASRRDKLAEVRWGIADFRRRFGRMPEGMWLPETAVDDETLGVLASEGIRFTVLAPHQVEDPPADGSPVLVTTSGGRSIAIVPYDGAAAGDVAFGQLLADPSGEALAARLTAAADAATTDASNGPTLTAIAADGETFGHHHKLGARALAGAVVRLRARREIRLENFASFLDRNPARKEGRIRSDTSWSCSHGIERWRGDCDCHVAPPTSTPDGHRWRAPLRDALDWLGIRLGERFERDAARLFGDPWAARDGYGAVVAEDGDALRDYAVEQLRAGPMRGTIDAASLEQARELLEFERSALRMFTSCAWFFDEVSGLETQLALRFAAYALALAGAESLRPEFLSRLTGSNESGLPAVRLVPHPEEHLARALSRAAAGLAAVRSLTPQLRKIRIGCYDVALAGSVDLVHLDHRRTGSADRATVGLARDGRELRVIVRLADRVGEPSRPDAIALKVSELTEREASFLRLARQIGVPPAPPSAGHARAGSRGATRSSHDVLT
jgi:uncharacterized protein DUF3536/glycosyl hydrolase family 57